jgi:hypothetical protein
MAPYGNPYKNPADPTAQSAGDQGPQGIHLHVGQQGAQRHIGEPTVCRHVHPTTAYLPEDARHGPAKHREFIALHAAFAHRRIIGAPRDGHGAPAHNQRDDEQMPVSFDGPVEGQPARAMRRELDKGVQQDGVSQVPGLQSCVVEQPRPALGRCLLIAKATGQLGLTAGLLGNNGPYKVPDGFTLMAMCPGQLMWLYSSGHTDTRTSVPLERGG